MFWLVLACALALPFAAVSVGSLVQRGVATPVTNPADFRTFACAARVLASGQDPYRTEPLRTCEHAGTREFGLAMFDGLVLPAPLPPYALLLFLPLASLPFPAANLLWFAISLAAVGLAAVALVRLGGVPLPVAGLAMFGAAAYVSLPLGQVVPLVVALLCGAALAARSGRYRVAAVLCALATIEPHIALPACLALLIFEPRARAALVALGIVALVASLAVAGPNVCLEYVRDVVPAHAGSQVGRLDLQYSLTALLHAVGVGAPAALLLGTLSYAAMVIAGIALAGVLAGRYADAAFLVLLPPAFALAFGTYVHLAQMAIALPAIALLIGHARRPWMRRTAYAALVALSIPWASIADSGAFDAVLWPHATPPRAVALPPADVSALAETTESDFAAGGGYGSNGATLLESLALKVPTWAALLLLIAISAKLSPRVPRPALE